MTSQQFKLAEPLITTLAAIVIITLTVSLSALVM